MELLLLKEGFTCCQFVYLKTKHTGIFHVRIFFGVLQRLLNIRFIFEYLEECINLAKYVI